MPFAHFAEFEHKYSRSIILMNSATILVYNIIFISILKIQSGHEIATTQYIIDFIKILNYLHLALFLTRLLMYRAFLYSRLFMVILTQVKIWTIFLLTLWRDISPSGVRL